MTAPALQERVLERYQFVENLVRTAHERAKEVREAAPEVFIINLADAILRYLAARKMGLHDPRGIGRNFYPPLAKFFEEVLSSVADFARTTEESDDIIARFLGEVTKSVVSSFQLPWSNQET